MANWMTPNERDLYRVYQAWRNSPSQPISQVIRQLGSSISAENFSHGMRRLAARAQSIPGWTQHSVRMAEASRMARAGRTLSTVSSFSLRTIAANGVRAAATFLGPAGIVTVGSLLLIAAVGLSIYWYNQSRLGHHGADNQVAVSSGNAKNHVNTQATTDSGGRGNDLGAGLRHGTNSRSGRPNPGGTNSGLISVPRGVGVLEELPRAKPKPSVTVAVGQGGIDRRKAWEQAILNQMATRQFTGTWSGSSICPRLEMKQDGRTFRGFIWLTVEHTDKHYITRKVPVQGTITFRGREPVEATLDLGFARGSVQISRKGSLAQGSIDGRWVIFSNAAAKKEREELEKRYPFGG